MTENDEYVIGYNFRNYSSAIYLKVSVSVLKGNVMYNANGKYYLDATSQIRMNSDTSVVSF